MPERFSRRPAHTSAALLRIVLAVLLLIPSSFAVAFAAGGQTGTVEGTILSDRGAPLAGATVTLTAATGLYTQKTDAKGFFSFLAVVQDTYTISVEYQGYEPYAQPGINVIGGNTMELGSLRLQPHLRTIGKVTARSGANSAFTPNQTVPQFTVSGAQIEAAQGKQANADETNLILSVPGFQLSSMGNLILQGSTTDEVHFQLDGVDFTDPGFNGDNSGLMANGVGSLQVVPGAGDPSQGNSGAGVVNIVTKRGTNPPFGLLDVETDSYPFRHQLNFEYGFASPNGRYSDYFSFLGYRRGYQFGGNDQTAFQTNSVFAPSYNVENDFVNNFIYKFGKDQSKSVQVLYRRHDDWFYNNYGNVTFCYFTCAPDYIPLLDEVAGFSPTNLGAQKLLQSVATYDPGQTAAVQNIDSDIDSVDQSSMIKTEFDDAFNPSTYLALRLFHSDALSSFAGNTLAAGGPEAVTTTPQQSGGSRTGGNFELSKQFSSKHLVTLSGTYMFNLPNFASLSGLVGLEDIGPDFVDFLRPPNVNAPISASNPCPSISFLWQENGGPFPNGSVGCYLQQYFYRQGGAPRVPPLDLRIYNFQQQFGYGIRDQFQMNSRMRFDFGMRVDGVHQHYPDPATQNVRTSPDPYDASTYYIPNFGGINNPLYFEPRFGGSYNFGARDSVGVSYGRSIILGGAGMQSSLENDEAFLPFKGIPLNTGQAVAGYPGGTFYAPFVPTGNPFTGVTPVGNDNCLFNVYVRKVKGQVVNGIRCPDFAALMYGVNDAFFPELTPVVPGSYDNLDVQFSHAFRNGSALKVDGFYRVGTQVVAITAPLVFIASSGTYQPGTLTNTPDGINKTTGMELYYTLPDRPQGFSGFASLTYVNEFTNTPPGSDNPYGQDFEPIILPQSLAAGNLYRAGFVSPLTLQLGGVYKTHSGWRFNPVLSINRGYPYGVGNLTPLLYNGKGINVYQTNLTDQYGAPGATNYIDPANPGSLFNPNVAATRGTCETSAGGGCLSRPQMQGDMTIEYTRARSTFGIQVLNLFGNIYGLPTINGNYQIVTTGHAGPLAGQSQTGAAFPYVSPLTLAPGSLPYSPYVYPITQYGTSFRFYYQRAL